MKQLSSRLVPVLAGSSIVAALAIGSPRVVAAPRARAYAVATESPAGTREAASILRAGGNAIDAAVCAALVSGFTNPSSSGMGGGGFALIWSVRDQRSYAFDFREVAPAGIDPTALDKRPLPAERRGQSVGVPGEVAGLFELEQRFGNLPWSTVVLRAAALAERGFATEPHTFEQLGAERQSLIGGSGAFRSVYMPRGQPPKLGATLRAAKLAAVLRRIASEGKRGFYEGPVAADIVDAVNGAGGAMTPADLRAYQVVQREPLRLDWNAKQILTMPPPSAGGLLLLQTLSLGQPSVLVGMRPEPSRRLHFLAEVMRGAAADRARFVGDPAFVPVDVQRLLSPERLLRRKALISDEHTLAQPRFGLEDAGTHHLVTADDDGNWVTLTTTINDAFGAKLVAERSGIILNNQLMDFTAPEALAPFGLSDSPNRARPGARPVSSMTPTLVLDGGHPVLALGGSGGLTIGPITTQVLISYLLERLPLEQAVAAPRFTIPSPTTGQTLWLEAALAARYGADLSQRGELWIAKDTKNAVQALAKDRNGFSAAADPRKSGTVSVNNPVGRAQ